MNAMSNPDYHHGDLREALLDAAEAGLQKNPRLSLSIRALASELGVSATAPHAHFRTKADLLAAIEREGSITRAAKAMGMSYRRAWLLVETMNACFTAPLVEASRGGSGGGGSGLTDLGRDVLARYRALEAKAAAAIAEDLEAFAPLLAQVPRKHDDDPGA